MAPAHMKVSMAFANLRVLRTAGKPTLQIALDAGIPMEHLCPRNDREENMDVTEDPDRLSYQAQVNGDVTVEVIEYGNGK